MDSDDTSSSTLYTTANKALHSIAAHLHRYRSELNSLIRTTKALKGHEEIIRHGHKEPKNIGHSVGGLEQIISQVEATNDFAQELEKKIQNILALVSANG